MRAEGRYLWVSDAPTLWLCDRQATPPCARVVVEDLEDDRVAEWIGRHAPATTVAPQPAPVMTDAVSEPRLVAPPLSLRAANTAATPAAGLTVGRVVVANGLSPDPLLVAGVARGTISASTLSADCPGMIGEQADLVLQVGAAINRARMMVAGLGDTVLVVQAPDGTYRCVDDAVGLDPVIDGALAAGEHRIWVGTYTAEVSVEYRLVLTADESREPDIARGPAP